MKNFLDTLSQIKSKRLWTEGTPLKLHLGCGENHLEGYVNIDYPLSEHTVQRTSGADLYADIRTLDFPNQSIDEIRLHHVFEHFDRPAAMAMLCNWHLWLKIGGTLLIETPDFKESIKIILSLRYSYEQKQSVVRHIFGSHEAEWAVHRDGWYKEKFQHVLGALGFQDLQFETGKWQMLRNITVRAKKQGNIDIETLKKSAKGLMRESMVDKSAMEERQWQVWCEKFGKYWQGNE